DRQALAALDTFIARGKPGRAYCFRAVLHAQAGRAGQARRDLAAFVRVSTSRGLTLWATALVDFYLGEEDRALKGVQSAVNANPTDAFIAYNAACVYGRVAQITQARQAACAAGLTAAPRSWVHLAVPSRTGQAARYADRAIALLEKAVVNGYRNFT